MKFFGHNKSPGETNFSECGLKNVLVLEEIIRGRGTYISASLQCPNTDARGTAVTKTEYVGIKNPSKIANQTKRTLGIMAAAGICTNCPFSGCSSQTEVDSVRIDLATEQLAAAETALIVAELEQQAAEAVKKTADLTQGLSTHNN